jgi:hypothetical protein
MKYLAIFLAGLLSASALFGFLFLRPTDFPLARPTIENEINPGCALISPFPQLLAHNFIADNRPRAFLVNKRTKRVVKEWSTSFPVFTAKLDQQGGLWALTNKMWDGDSPAEIIRLNEKSERTARVFVPGIVEDFDFGREEKSIFLIQQYTKAGKGRDLPFKYERILEVEPGSGKILWQWDAETLGLPETQLNGQQSRTGAISHINSVRYVSSNPINMKPAVLISARNVSRIYLVDYDTRKVIWESPAGIMEFQHDARLLDNGDLLFFNNRRLSAFTSVDQFNMKRNELVWQYRSATEQDFHSALLGGAQRLPNGNTLITDAMRGHVFEVNSRKEVVWEYFQHMERNPPSSAWPVPPLFRVENYEPDFIGRLGWGTICR